jgi:DNA transformation protein and related proteins
MNEVKGDKLCVALGASKVRRRLKGHGFGVRKVYADGKNRAVIIHTATGDHLRQLEAFFQDVLTTPADSRQPRPDENR